MTLVEFAAVLHHRDRFFRIAVFPVTQFESGDGFHERYRLFVQGRGGFGCVLNQHGVLLRHTVDLRDRPVYRFDADTLFLTCDIDVSHDLGHLFDRGHDFIHRLACGVNQLASSVHFFDRIADQLLDFLRGACGSLRKRTYFACHHGKAASLFAGTRGFHCRIQGQDIGLKCNAVYDADDVHDLA